VHCAGGSVTVGEAGGCLGGGGGGEDASNGGVGGELGQGSP